jgi:hypothetical protein
MVRNTIRIETNHNGNVDIYTEKNQVFFSKDDEIFLIGDISINQDFLAEVTIADGCCDEGILLYKESFNDMVTEKTENVIWLPKKAIANDIVLNTNRVFRSGSFDLQVG